MAVIVTNIYAKKDSFETCPRFVVKLAKRYYPRYMKNFPPEDHELKLSPVGANSRWRQDSCNGRRQGDIMSITDGELDSLTGGDSCCAGSKSNSAFEPEVHARYNRGKFRDSLPHQQSFDREKNDAEWQMVAKFADRVLFWVYFILSTSTQVVLFVNMIPSEEDTKLPDL
jgi:hypothetical protein